MDYKELKERYDFLKSGKLEEKEVTNYWGISPKISTRAIDSLKKGNVEAFLVRNASDTLATEYSYHIEVFSEEENGLKNKRSFDFNAGFRNGHGLYTSENDDPFFFEGATGNYEYIGSVELAIRDIYRNKNKIQVVIANTVGNRKTIETLLSN